MTKKIEVIIKMPTEQCSDAERDYMRVRYICKLLEWKQKELNEQAEQQRRQVAV